jgi:hypothetical protein
MNAARIGKDAILIPQFVDCRATAVRVSSVEDPSGAMCQLDRPQRLLWARAFRATRIPDHRRVVSMLSVPVNVAIG